MKRFKELNASEMKNVKGGDHVLVPVKCSNGKTVYASSEEAGKRICEYLYSEEKIKTS